MLVHHDRRDVVQIQHLARSRHAHRQIDGLLARHAVQKDGHRPGRSLIVGNLALRIPVDKQIDLGATQLASISFFGNHIYSVHRLSSLDHMIAGLLYATELMSVASI